MKDEKVQTKVESVGQKQLSPRSMSPRSSMMNQTETKKPQKHDESRTSQRARKNSGKKKFWIIFACVMSAIAIAATIVVLIVSNLPAKRLSTPTNLMIVQSGNAVYAVCDKVDGATKYIFEIDEKKYDSKAPVLDLSKFSEPKQYSIKVFAYGKKRGSLSAASQKIFFDLRKKLQAPEIHFYESGSSEICWASIQNATSYEIICNNEIKNIGNVLRFDLNTLDAGENCVQVRAKGGYGYVESEFSNSLTHKVFKKLQAPTGKVLSGGKIEINKVENAIRYEVTINAAKFGVDKFEDASLRIDLIDAGIAKDTFVSYFKIEAVGENYFVSNSAELDTTICEA